MENKKTYIIVGVIAAIICIAVVAVILLDDSKKNEDKNNTVNTTSQNSTNRTTNTSNTNNGNTNETDVDYEAAAEKQFAKPESGETIAIMHVKNFGDITFKFFEDKAPKAVENFLTHSREGYYNGVKFHRVMEDFMIQGGDPKGDGTGGESIWGKGFEEEFADELVPYRGALCMASSGVGKSSLGSQFFIVQANADEQQAALFSRYGIPEKLSSTYLKYGGYMSLYKSYTVFGQVVEGMDVVDKIVAVEKKESMTGEMSVPVEDIIIESIEVKTQE